MTTSHSNLFRFVAYNIGSYDPNRIDESVDKFARHIWCHGRRSGCRCRESNTGISRMPALLARTGRSEMITESSVEGGWNV